MYGGIKSPSYTHRLLSLRRPSKYAFGVHPTFRFSIKNESSTPVPNSAAVPKTSFITEAGMLVSTSPAAATASAPAKCDMAIMLTSFANFAGADSNRPFLLPHVSTYSRINSTSDPGSDALDNHSRNLFAVYDSLKRAIRLNGFSTSENSVRRFENFSNVVIIEYLSTGLRRLRSSSTPTSIRSNTPPLLCDVIP